MHYRPYQAETDAAIHARAIAEAFATQEADIEKWVVKLGPENIRVMEHEGAYAGTCVMLPMGQFFGGRSVRMCGIAGVAVLPQFRGKGVGQQMMQAVVREMAASGVSLSTLYPSTIDLYRRTGYELAGVWGELEMSFDQLPPVAGSPNAHPGPSSLRVRPVELADHERIARWYRAEIAPTRPGHLDRGKYIWDRVFHPRGAATYSYLFEDESSQIRGFVSLQQEAPDHLEGWQRITVTGMDAADAEAWGSVLAHLRSYASMGRQLLLPVGPGHPILLQFRQQRWKHQIREAWMTRILNLRSALESRGYAPQINGNLLLQVTDSLLEQNQGVFELRVENGVAQCQQLDPTPTEIDQDRLIRLDIGHLAPLYTGYMSAEQLAQTGGIVATAAALQLASALFQGSLPSCPEMF
jgi:predicted acetyltransferase